MVHPERLPPDVWLEVFDLVKEDWPYVMLRIGGVCKYWRWIVRTTPGLWRVLELKSRHSSDLARLWKDCSGNRIRCLRIHEEAFASALGWAQELRTLDPTALKKLSLHCPSTEHLVWSLNTSLAPLSTRALPQLEGAWFYLTNQASKKPVNLSAFWNCIFGHFFSTPQGPLVKELGFLHFSELHPRWVPLHIPPEFTFAHLRKLDLARLYPSHIVAFLVRCPKLEALSIADCLQDDPDPPRHALTLPTVRDLQIDGIDCDLLGPLLCPNLVHLEMLEDYSPQPPALLRARLDSVRELELPFCTWPAQTLYDTILRCPNVEFLDLCAYRRDVNDVLRLLSFPVADPAVRDGSTVPLKKLTRLSLWMTQDVPIEPDVLVDLVDARLPLGLRGPTRARGEVTPLESINLDECAVTTTRPFEWLEEHLREFITDRVEERSPEDEYTEYSGSEASDVVEYLT
ncbi:hypothetical protein PUNSTDRAFT_130779 [Punctularia strigosozonata HHB-11173 SS5]|uniref:uncharacterized protein n=1 Tax=Punctularia strigosozonata (strain HHB-11173) TaxID=741275 RepID=UPI0004418664|nr:uncharacterized protein PUNSTDRAFT_130779 [Punctularia strigosozonata HHB-11173 SS5]EIN12522.1 hypothetical protein PUNSTDRAFT_130779 [Punctularia strigosozonata HHB-11173 SS5]